MARLLEEAASAAIRTDISQAESSGAPSLRPVTPTCDNRAMPSSSPTLLSNLTGLGGMDLGLEAAGC